MLSEPEPLMSPPQLFSKQDVPLDYAYRSYYGGDPDSFKAGACSPVDSEMCRQLHASPQAPGYLKIIEYMQQHCWKRCKYAPCPGPVCDDKHMKRVLMSWLHAHPGPLTAVSICRSGCWEGCGKDGSSCHQLSEPARPAACRTERSR